MQKPCEVVLHYPWLRLFYWVGLFIFGWAYALFDLSYLEGATRKRGAFLLWGFMFSPIFFTIVTLKLLPCWNGLKLTEEGMTIPRLWGPKFCAWGGISSVHLTKQWFFRKGEVCLDERTVFSGASACLKFGPFGGNLDALVSWIGKTLDAVKAGERPDLDQIPRQSSWGIRPGVLSGLVFLMLNLPVWGIGITVWAGFFKKLFFH